MQKASPARGCPRCEGAARPWASHGRTLPASLPGHLALDAFDVPVDRVDLLVGERLAFGHPDRAVVAFDRTGEGMELARDDLGLPRRHRLLRGLRDALVDA